MANKPNIRKAFEAIAYIIGEREHKQIAVCSLTPKEHKGKPPDIAP